MAWDVIKTPRLNLSPSRTSRGSPITILSLSPAYDTPTVSEGRRERHVDPLATLLQTLFNRITLTLERFYTSPRSVLAAHRARARG